MTTLPARKRWLLQDPTWWAMTALVLACALLQLDATLREDTASPAFTVAGALMIVQLAVFGAVAALIARTRLQQATVESGAARRVRRLFFGSGAVLSFLAIAWGATVVPAVAAYANTQHFAILTRLGLRSIAASIAAPLDEDLLRLAGTLGVLALCARASGARGGLTPLDGLLYGFLVGAGFEIAENADAVLGAVGDDPLHAALHLALVRTSLGFGLHALWTGLTGAALSYCLARRRAGRGARWWLLALATLIPMLLHALWDAPALSIDPSSKLALLTAVYVTTLALFAVVWGCAWKSLRRELRRSVSGSTELRRPSAPNFPDTTAQEDQR